MTLKHNQQPPHIRTHMKKLKQIKRLNKLHPNRRFDVGLALQASIKSLALPYIPCLVWGRETRPHPHTGKLQEYVMLKPLKYDEPVIYVLSSMVPQRAISCDIIKRGGIYMVITIGYPPLPPN